MDIKQVNGEYNFSTWKPKGIYNSGLKSLHDLGPAIKYFGSKIGLQFNNSVLVAEQSNYTIKIINAYIIHDLNNWSRNLLNKFTLKNCLFGVTNIVNNSDKSNYVYSGCRGAFDVLGSWSFGNDFARNVLIVVLLK